MQSEEETGHKAVMKGWQQWLFKGVCILWKGANSVHAHFNSACLLCECAALDTGYRLWEAILSQRRKASSLPFMLTKTRRGWVSITCLSRVLWYLGITSGREDKQWPLWLKFHWFRSQPGTFSHKLARVKNNERNHHSLLAFKVFFVKIYLIGTAVLWANISYGGDIELACFLLFF